jgi:hypothetical protein
MFPSICSKKQARRENSTRQKKKDTLSEPIIDQMMRNLAAV